MTSDFQITVQLHFRARYGAPKPTSAQDAAKRRVAVRRRVREMLLKAGADLVTPEREDDGVIEVQLL